MALYMSTSTQTWITVYQADWSWWCLASKSGHSRESHNGIAKQHTTRGHDAPLVLNAFQANHATTTDRRAERHAVLAKWENKTCTADSTSHSNSCNSIISIDACTPLDHTSQYITYILINTQSGTMWYQYMHWLHYMHVNNASKEAGKM